jgi:PPM family protein phosphatase
MDSQALDPVTKSRQQQKVPSAAPALVKSHGITDRGKVRDSNEDHFLIAELVRALWVHQSSVPHPQTRFGNNRGHIFLVADGVGGASAGEVASALTVSTIEGFVLHFLRRFTNLKVPDEHAVLKDFQMALQAASARIFEETAHHPEFSGMGTTLTMAFVSNWLLFVVHAGDSRCYLYRRGALRQLTNDHTLAAEMVRRGLLRPDELVNHQYRHVVTNIVGGFKPNLLPDVRRFDLEPDDVLLICSDGLSEMLSDADISAVLGKRVDPRIACEQLIGMANDRGGKDNTTAVVARFEATDDCAAEPALS